ncbi:carboxypeptidase regulatory-like domain-containing protein [Pseudoduganella aquatica]|uniref:Carboxypeptidase regulatory-like domain-containing protein n=1 Tax=Pseudoduganella aquatica TaxID=2660641 RepID=A0A7X4HCV1_9BURK|nr:carboxypeptidase regulatory-like domain-containing protein [Pseudoduganella aquatica]MYN08599.1 carboxypeptidase regulatory-like domain-containing protein [Pseudoduganella aquatica]
MKSMGWRATFASAAVLAGLAGAAIGMATAAQDGPGAAYLNGGAGEEERQELQQQGAGYTLLLRFANRGSGAYRADVDVEIRDAKGAAQLQLAQAGPLLYVRLPSGSYQITARAAGQTQTRRISVADGAQRELVLYWAAPPDEQEP